MEMPRKNTHWKVVGTRFQFEITDLWGKGFGDSYQITEYEFKYTHLEAIQRKTAAEVMELIKTEKIKQTNIN